MKAYGSKFEQKNVLDTFYCEIFYYLCGVMKSPFEQLGNVPVTTATLKSFFPRLSDKNQKLRILERDKQIVRLKRGLYVCSPDVTGKPFSTELIANHIYTPSYISMSTALRYYGLIPEAVYVTQSMTLKRSRDFDTPLGRFEYTRISKAAFPIGVMVINKAQFTFLMATPEKALCDLIANSPMVNLRYMRDAEKYLEEDIRMESDDFMAMNPAIFEAYAEVGKKGDSIRTLLKLMKQ